MKALSFALLLMASVAFVLGGCSDNAGMPVSPADQSVQEAVSLEKSTNVSITATSFPIYADPNPLNYITIAGGTLHMKDYPVWDQVIASDPLVSGVMKHQLSLMLDVVSGEGPCHGKWTSEPEAAGGGKWEGTYEGYRSKTADPLVFSLPLKMVAHGKGGSIDKMQFFMVADLTVYTDAAHYPLPTSWSATGTGFIKKH